MTKYEAELESLITNILLPAYINYCRITGAKVDVKAIHSRLLETVKYKEPKIPALFKRGVAVGLVHTKKPTSVT